MSILFRLRSAKFVLLAAVIAVMAGVVGCSASSPFKTWMNSKLSYLNSPDASAAAEGESFAGDEKPVMPEGEFLTTASGLRYRIIKEGSGRAPLPNSKVTCHYRGWLDDGTEFDSSYKRNKPAEFSLKNVVPGWTEGLQLIAKGGKIELEVPASLGYGPGGRPPTIPGGATLHFEIELLHVD